MVHLGEALPDYFDPLSSFVGAHIAQLGDLGDFLEEYATLEREHATKIQALVRKTRAQRDRRLSELCVGSNPQRAWDPADPNNKSTFQTFLTKVLDNQEATATAHDALGSALSSVVADIGRSQTVDDGLLKAHIDFQRKLRSERDAELEERVRCKTEYDQATQVVEAQRHRVERREANEKPTDKGHKNKAAADLDMKHAKDSYLLSVTAANEANAHYFHHSIPALQEGLQQIWSFVTEHLTSRLQRANEHFLTFVERTRGYVDDTDKSVQSVQAGIDQALYARFNQSSSPWAGPEQWKFEPYPTFYDTSDFVVESELRPFLQNRLIRARQLLRDVTPQTEKAQGVYAALQAKLDQGSNKDSQQLQRVLESQYVLLPLQLKESCLAVEDELLVEVSGDIDADVRPHTFKSTIKIPTSCAVCNKSVWGINKQAMHCQACGTTAHLKCSLRIPAQCTKSGVKSGVLTRVDTTRSLPTRTTSRAGREANHPGLPAASKPSTSATLVSDSTFEPAPLECKQPDVSSSASSDGPGDKAEILYDYEASGPSELSLTPGQALYVIAPDTDSSGWTKAVNSEGQQGFVPTAYINVSPVAATKAALPGQAAGHHGKVRALYDFDASDVDELSLQAGEVVDLTPLGHHVAEGWVEGVKSSGKKGIFPSSYVTDVQ